MKVGFIPRAAQFNPYKEAKKAKHPPSAGSQSTDKLDLDESRHQFDVAMREAHEVPEVRTEKVEAIKKQIEAGTYKVDSREIVEKILEQHRR